MIAHRMFHAMTTTQQGNQHMKKRKWAQPKTTSGYGMNSNMTEEGETFMIWEMDNEVDTYSDEKIKKERWIALCDETCQKANLAGIDP